MKNSIENIKGNLKNIKKVCSFYVSDYHFEMIALPYIKRELKKNNKVMILSENNLCDSIKKILDRSNIDQEEKNEIYNIDWNNNKDIKLKLIKKEESDMTVFIKGGVKYINEINEYLNNSVDSKNIRAINCFNIIDIKDDIKNIKNQYQGVLNVSGEYKF